MGGEALFSKILTINEAISAFVWGTPMIIILIGVGIFLAVKIRFFKRFSLIQILKSPFKKSDKDSTGKTITPFQSVAAALAGTLGTGNIIGVSTALCVGGPGVLFWMGVSGIIGMVTKYAETVLAMKYRTKDDDGAYLGGPMYYLEFGLKSKLLAIIFCVCCIAASLFGGGNCTQINSLSVAMNETFGTPFIVCGIVSAVIVGYIVSGGVKKIGRVMEISAPILSVLFILGCFIVIFANYKNIVTVTMIILKEAFSFKAAVSGTVSFGIMSAMRFGFSRGIFSNEAGMGSSPILHAASHNDPESQGLCGSFEVFFDTIVVATITGYAILTSGVFKATGEILPNLTSDAFSSVMGSFGGRFVAVSIVIFALSSMPCWFFYGEKCVSYLTKKKAALIIYRVLYIAIVIISPLISLKFIWDIADTLNGIMMLPNIIAIVLLSNKLKS